MGRSQPVRADDFVVAVVRLFEPCGPQPPAAEARKRAPQAAPDIPYEVTALTFAVKPLFRTLRRIPHSDCLTAPAAGYRVKSSGALACIGDESLLWSSSSNLPTSHNAAGFHFHGVDVLPLSGNNRSYAFSVRCVQHPPDSLFKVKSEK